MMSRPCMPSRSGRYRFSPAPAATEALAGLGDGQGSGRASTLTSAWWPQLAHDAVTMRTPFWRMLASDIGGPGRGRLSGRPFCLRLFLAR